jgi:sigma-B regulation protein RsbU (phosphoserine phosphatase)
VGGDFYDVFRASDGNVALVIGDVSGKGLPAALLSGVIHGAVRSARWFASPAEQEHESAQLDRLLCANSSGNRFASMFWCYYDAPARRLHYVNAGHCPPILLQRAGARTVIDSLDEGGPVLGLLVDATYGQARREICSGDVLVLYSDGLVECTNASGEEYGEERLQALLRGEPAQDPDAVCRAVTGSVADFLGGAIPRDDLTLVVAKFV